MVCKKTLKKQPRGLDFWRFILYILFMSKIQLTKNEKKELKELQKQTKDKRVYRKIAVILGLDSGFDYISLSDILSLDETTIRRYEKDYLSKGAKEFLKDDFKGYWGKLNSFQLAKLVKELNANLYQTTKEIADWIEKEFGVKYNSQGLVHLLHRLGFVYKQTKLIPSKADKQAQEEFLKKFKELKENLSEDEVIYFGDAVHPQHNTKSSNGWIQKGKEKLIKSNTGRTRVNLNGVLDPVSKEVIIREDDTINAQSTIELFKELEKKNKDKSKIYVIVDNARYYRSKLLSEFVAGTKIELIFLPPYSPNLNLIERLWKFMRKKIINNKYYEKSTEFRRKLLEFFDNINIYKDELDSLLTCNFQIFEPN